MPAEVIGRCTCPVCRSDKASLRLSAKQLAYVHCNTCHFQGFSRSDASDTKLRALLIPDTKPEPEAAAPAAPAAPIVVPLVATKAPAKASSWGVKSW